MNTLYTKSAEDEIDEYRKDMKGSISDLKNIGGSRFAGTAKAAAFLEEFIKNIQGLEIVGKIKSPIQAIEILNNEVGCCCCWIHHH